MRQTAAERTARADRIMRDVARDKRQQPTCHAAERGPVKRRVTHAGSDRQDASLHLKPIKAFDTVDVDQVRGPRHPECHDRNKALPAGEDTSVKRRKFVQSLHRLLDRPWRVSGKGRGFHRKRSPKLKEGEVCLYTNDRSELKSTWAKSLRIN